MLCGAAGGVVRGFYFGYASICQGKIFSYAIFVCIHLSMCQGQGMEGEYDIMPGLEAWHYLDMSAGSGLLFVKVQRILFAIYQKIYKNISISG